MKSLGQYSYLITAVVGGILVLGLLWYGAKPALGAIVNNRRQVSQLDQQLQETQDRLTSLKAFSQKPQEFEAMRDLLRKTLPEKADSDTFAIRIEQASSDLKLSLSNLSVTPPKPKAAPKAATPVQEEATDTKSQTATATPTAAISPTPAASAPQTADQTFGFSTAIVGSYEQIRDFLGTLERFAPFSAVRQFSITPSGEQYSASIAGTVSFLPTTPGSTLTGAFTISTELKKHLDELSAPGTPIDLKTESGFGKDNPFK